MALEYRIFWQGVEALVPGATTDAQVYGVTAEALVPGGVTDAQVFGLTVEALVPGDITFARVYLQVVEVLQSIHQGFFPDFLDEAEFVGDLHYEDRFLPDFIDDSETPPAILIQTRFFPTYIDIFDADIFDVTFIGIDVRIPPPVPAEWNPFRPDVPHDIAGSAPPLYDYLREQAETLREQHNLTQAGDSSFPWEMATREGARSVHTLGSITRFFHETYGLITGRYVKFSDNWVSSRNPIVGNDKTRGEWVVTNKADKATLFRVVGISGPFKEAIGGAYGWVLTGGRSPLPVTLLSSIKPIANQRFTWDLVSNGFASIAAGPAVGLVIDPNQVTEIFQLDDSPYSPRRWLLPAGSWLIDVQGVTNEQIAAVGAAAVGALDARIDEVELLVAAIDAVDTAGLVTSIATANARITAEITARSNADFGLSARIGSIEGLNLASYPNAASYLALTARVLALELALPALETSVTTTLTAHVVRLTALEDYQYTSDVRLSAVEDGLIMVIGTIAGLVPGVLTATGLAGETISGQRAVRFDTAGTVWLADKDSVAFAPHTAGIITGAVVIGEIATVLLQGKFDEVSWTWTQGPIWLGDDGQLTQTPPTTGVLVQIGLALKATSIRVAPQLIAIL